MTGKHRKPDPIPRITVKWSAWRQRWVGRCPAQGCSTRNSGHTRKRVEEELAAHYRGKHVH
jgi:hypothetical protein